MLSNFQRIVVVLLFVLSLSPIGATPPPKSVPLKLDKGKGGGNKSPIYVPFSCESTDDGIVILSSRDIIGEVKIVNEDGEIIAETCGNFNPELFIPVDDFSGRLTITIYIADWDMTYVGYIEGE